MDEKKTVVVNTFKITKTQAQAVRLLRSELEEELERNISFAQAIRELVYRSPKFKKAIAQIKSNSTSTPS